MTTSFENWQERIDDVQGTAADRKNVTRFWLRHAEEHLETLGYNQARRRSATGAPCDAPSQRF